MIMKVLFLCPNYFEIHKIIEKEICEYFNCEIETIIFKKYVYANKYENIKNFFSKTFLKKNLKKNWASKQSMQSININDTYDYIFIICPDFLINDDLKLLNSISKQSIVYYWDSFDNISSYERTVKYFNKHFSFEPKDVKNYNFSFLTNFYFKTDNKAEVINDVFFIGTYDKRFSKILEIGRYLNLIGKKTIINIYTKNKKIVNKYKETNIKFIDKIIGIAETEELLKQSAVILDVQKQIQDGLTFRVFEAIGHKKKLITTNQNIKNYDFYNPTNIFIWTDETTSIPSSFFNEPYEDLEIDIYNKYGIKNWVKTIFEN